MNIDVTLVVIFHIAIILFKVDVAGMMHLWGLTVDTVTSIMLIIAIGLAVDYSAHIGHCFMTISGERNGKLQSHANLNFILLPEISGMYICMAIYLRLMHCYHKWRSLNPIDFKLGTLINSNMKMILIAFKVSGPRSRSISTWLLRGASVFYKHRLPEFKSFTENFPKSLLFRRHIYFKCKGHNDICSLKLL